MKPPMIDLKNAFRTTVLLVDDDTRQLEMRALTMKMSGFSVVIAGGAVEAISLMHEPSSRRIDVAVIDYHMPVMNGCVLAEDFRTRYPELKTVLYSGAIDIPEEEMSSLDAFVSKSEGVDSLLAKITELQHPGNFPGFTEENNGDSQAAN